MIYLKSKISKENIDLDWLIFEERYITMEARNSLYLHIFLFKSHLNKIFSISNEMSINSINCNMIQKRV